MCCAPDFYRAETSRNSGPQSNASTFLAGNMERVYDQEAVIEAGEADPDLDGVYLLGTDIQRVERGRNALRKSFTRQVDHGRGHVSPLRFRRNSTRQPHATTVARPTAIRVSFAHPDHCSQRMYSVSALSAAASKPRARQSCSTCGHAMASSIPIENAGQLGLTLTQQANRALCSSSIAFAAQCNMASAPNHVRVATSSGRPNRSHGRRPHRFVDLISLALSHGLLIFSNCCTSFQFSLVPRFERSYLNMTLPMSGLCCPPCQMPK